MKYLINILFLFLSINSFGQASYNDTLVVPFDRYADSLEKSYRFSIYQVIGQDSIVLSDKWEYFGAIQIFRNGKKVFEFIDKDDRFVLEIDVFENSICKVSNDYYIFNIDKRPSINAFFAIKATGNKFDIIGETETNSAFIFADVDNDGKFEIGGFKHAFEAEIDHYGLREKVYQDKFRIFELSENGITRDEDLEGKFMNAILERIDIPCSGSYTSFVITNPILDANITVNSIRKYAALSIYKIWDSELNGISKKELRIMRNEIFASYGYKFKSEDLQKYFSKQTWYEPKEGDVLSNLTEIEKFNIQFIKKKESE